MTNGCSRRLPSGTAGKPVLTGTDPDVLETRNGGGCISLFGLPFLAGGVFTVLTALGVVPARVDGNRATTVLLFFMGIIFTCVGSGLVFGRSGLILDRRRHRVLLWWGLLVPMKRTEYLVESFDRVVMEYQPGDSDSAESWRISLAGASLPGPVRILTSSGYAGARELAGQISRFLGKPLEDLSAGARIVRGPDSLDENLIARLKKDGGVPEPPRLPAGSKVRIEETGEHLVLLLPARDWGRIRWLSLLPGVVFASLVTIFFVIPFLRLPSAPAIRYGFLVFLGIFFILGPVISSLRMFLHVRESGALIALTPFSLRVEETQDSGKSVTEIPLSELTELELPATADILESAWAKARYPSRPSSGVPGRMPDGRPVPRLVSTLLKHAGSPGITARSDKISVTFGKGIPETDAAFVHALLKKTILEFSQRENAVNERG